MNLLIQRLTGVATNDIQVSGVHEFPEARWREAILFYLFGIWSAQENVICRPKISFGGITLRLDLSYSEYFIYGQPTETYPDPPRYGQFIQCDNLQKEAVEVSLIRFIKNNRIKQLRIYLIDPGQGALIFWKKSRRGQYGCSGFDIPKTFEDALKAKDNRPL